MSDSDGPIHATDFRNFDIWEDDPRITVMAMDHIRHQFTARLIGSRPRRVVDLGCGDGYLSYLLASRGHAVTAIDGDPRRLEKFVHVAKAHGIKQVCADIGSLRPGQFQAEVLVCMEVLEHVPDIERAIRLIRSFVQAGGVGVFSVPLQESLFEGLVECPKCGNSFHRDGHVHSFRVGDLDRMLERLGFQHTRHWKFQSVFTKQFQMATRLSPGRTLLSLDRVFCALFPRLARRYIVIGRVDE